MSIFKILTFFFAGLLIFVVAFLAFHFKTNAVVTAEEVYRSDEAEQAQRSREVFIDIIKKNATTYAARGAHSKGHACVKAYFDVLESIDPELQHGIFKIPGKRYKSWIRFSNGTARADSRDADKDFRGMAVKLINIYDEDLEKTENSPETQDFVMHNHPVFAFDNIEDYNQFMEQKASLKYFVSGANPFKWRLRELKYLFDTLAPPPHSPLWDEYFSNTPYKLGPHNIKFSVNSCSSAEFDPGQDKTDPDFLRKTLAEELKRGTACFNFRVQLQDTDKYMPIEDPSIEWTVSDSPNITIAKIVIPVQEFNTAGQQAFCENLSFSPWNALPDHRPIGQLNRIRKAAYQASSEYRHARNQTEIPASLEWCLEGEPDCVMGD